jgi:hypothetical protein
VAWPLRIERFEAPGLIVRPILRGQPFTITYREILTAERARQSWRLVLHTTAMGEVDIWSRRGRDELELRLRRRGVRVVDCWGAIISATLADFEDELAREPTRVRQSSDNA